MSTFDHNRSDVGIALLWTVVIPGLIGLIIALIVIREWHQSDPARFLSIPRAGSLQEARQDLRTGRTEDAARLFAMLAKQGDPNAQYWLGYLSETGSGTKRDIDKAIELYKQAAERHVVAAQVQLGEIYLRGNVVLPDSGLAKTYLEQAAAQGNARAAMLMSELYKGGVGITPDLVQAYAWSEVATIEGSQPAMADRDAALHALDPAGQRAGIARAGEILAAIKQHASPN